MISVVVSSLLYGAEGEYNLEGVTVSANKIEEKIQDVPQSITVLSESNLEDREIKNVEGIIQEIPNMSFSPLYYQSVNFRGINQSIFTSNNPVTIYIDGVSQSNSYAYEASLANVDHVEVLRGPQGSLYGKDSIGGIINIITKLPKNEWGGTIGAEYGTDNYMYTTMSVGGAVVDDVLFVNVNGDYASDEGYITNLYDGEKGIDETSKHNIGVNMTWKPTDRFSAQLSLSDYYSRAGAMDIVGVPAGENINSYSRSDTKFQDWDVDNKITTKSNSQALNLKYAFDAMDLTSTTTHKKVEANGTFDLDTTYNGLSAFVDRESDTYTQELKLSSPNKEGFRWVAGLYYEKEDIDYPGYGRQYSYGTYGSVNINDASTQKAETYAAFGQVIVPFASHFEWTLGGRVQRIEKEIDSNYTLTSIDLYPGMDFATHHYDAKDSWTAFLPKTALLYKINDNLSAYASISTGYLPGGFNNYATSGGKETNMFEPQKSINYEVGVKGDTLDGTLFLGANIFYMDITDIHVYTQVGTIMTASNADKAHSQGIELEALYRPIPSIEMNGAVGLIQTEYDDYKVYSSGILVPTEGNKIERTPSYTAKIGIGYTHPSGVYGRVDVRAQGETYYNPENTIKADAYIVGDVKAGYRMKSGLDVYAYVQNVTNEDYIINATAQTLMPNYDTLVMFGEGRRVGVGFKYTF
ncbi:putative TonB-dependent receptor [Sulfurospirillum halorespirans DSM 13726]|uniref:Putative TonB-dependent receptor n=2 Tax=Sulfurospirillum halorespirans TaxID=194424 RepID=A0A1D7TMT4_9BACT|nr:putative TonB-dependent receptor [Sulfurospirillum halorespirans DSM 13726]